MELFLVAHDILGYISKSRWVITKDNEQEMHKPLGYKFFSIATLQQVLPQYDIKELKFAIDLLKENNHVDKLNADDWFHIRVACFESGEQAYERKFYINLHDKNKIESNENWKKKNWFLIAVFAFVIGSVIAPLTVEWLKHKIWPDIPQSTTPIPTASDTTSTR
jgi:hypothetical protein